MQIIVIYFSITSNELSKVLVPFLPLFFGVAEQVQFLENSVFLSVFYQFFMVFQSHRQFFGGKVFFFTFLLF